VKGQSWCVMGASSSVKSAAAIESEEEVIARQLAGQL
jgi:hypothetical protein